MRKTIALTVMAVLLSGCGMLPGQQGGGGEERQPSETAAQETVQSTTPPNATAPAESQSAPPQGTKVVATLEADIAAGDKAKARVDITTLKRQGKTVSLNWTITILEGQAIIYSHLGAVPSDESVSGVSLIDPVNAKRYRVARNGTGSEAACVCSKISTDWLTKGEAATFYAVFAAPPPDITKINVEMPLLGVLTDVPIS
jgi:hypothetical protein